jgi:glycosyltransferase involved in cell wall biosynthesis
VPISPPNAGNRTRIANLLEVLRGWGHRVSFVHTEAGMRGDGTEHVVRLARELRPDVVIQNYAHAATALTPAVSLGALKVLDTHDVFTRRNEKFLPLGIDYRGTMPSFDTADEEARALAHADVVIGIQEHDSHYFRQITDRPVVTVGHLAPVVPLPVRSGAARRLLFIGSASLVGKANLDRFLENVFPLVRAREPAATLVIAGEIGRLVDTLPAGCERLPYAENLRRLYEDIDVAISCEMMATGLSIKNTTALAFGRPLVTTPMGARGLEDGIGHAFVVARHEAEFADAVVELLRDGERRRRLGEGAATFAHATNRRNEKNLRAVLELAANRQPASPPRR